MYKFVNVRNGTRLQLSDEDVESMTAKSEAGYSFYKWFSMNPNEREAEIIGKSLRCHLIMVENFIDNFALEMPDGRVIFTAWDK